MDDEASDLTVTEMFERGPPGRVSFEQCIPDIGVEATRVTDC
jgi:hypothetical protein